MNSDKLDPKIQRNLELYSRLREETRILAATANLAQKRKEIYSFVDPVERNKEKDIFATVPPSQLEANNFFQTPVPEPAKRRLSRPETKLTARQEDIITSDQKLELSDLTNHNLEELHPQLDSLKSQESRIVNILSNRMQLLERMKSEQEDYITQRVSVEMENKVVAQSAASSYLENPVNNVDMDHNDSDSEGISDFLPMSPRQDSSTTATFSPWRTVVAGSSATSNPAQISSTSEEHHLDPATRFHSISPDRVYAQNNSAASISSNIASYLNMSAPRVQEVDSMEYSPAPNKSTGARTYSYSIEKIKPYVGTPTKSRRSSSSTSEQSVNAVPARKVPTVPHLPIAVSTTDTAQEAHFRGSQGPFGNDAPSIPPELPSPATSATPVVPTTPSSPQPRTTEIHFLPAGTEVKYTVYSPGQAPHLSKLEERARRRAEKERTKRMTGQAHDAIVGGKETDTMARSSILPQLTAASSPVTIKVPSGNNNLENFGADSVSSSLSSASPQSSPVVAEAPRRSSRSHRLFPPIRRTSIPSHQSTPKPQDAAGQTPVAQREDDSLHIPPPPPPALPEHSAVAPPAPAPLLPVVLQPGIRTTSNHNIYGLLSAAQKYRHNIAKSSATSSPAQQGNADDSMRPNDDGTDATSPKDALVVKDSKSPRVTPTEKPQLALVDNSSEAFNDKELALLVDTPNALPSQKVCSTLTLRDGNIVNLHSAKISNEKAVEAHRTLVSEPPRKMLDLLTCTETTINTNPLLQSQISRGLQRKLVPKAGEPEHLGQMARTVEGLLKQGVQQQEKMLLAYEHQRIMEEEEKIAEAAWKAYKEGALLHREQLLLETMERLHSTPTEQEVKDPKYRAEIEKQLLAKGYRVKKDFQPVTREELLETCKLLAERIDRTMIFDDGDISGITARDSEELKNSRNVLLKTKRFFDILYSNNRLAALPNLELQRSEYISRVRKYDKVTNRLDNATVGLSEKAKLVYPDLVYANDMDFLKGQYKIPPVDMSEHPVLHAAGIYVAQIQLQPGQNATTSSGPLLWRPFWAVLTSDALRFYKSDEDATLDKSNTIWYKRRLPAHYLPITPDREIPIPKLNVRDAERGINIIQQTVTVNLCRIEPPSFLPYVQYALVVTIVPTKVTPIVAADLPIHLRTTHVNVPQPTRWIMVFPNKPLLASWFGLFVGLLDANQEEANKYLNSIPEF